MASLTARVKPLLWKFFVTGSVIAFSSAISDAAQPLLLRLQLLYFLSHRVQVEELAVGAHLVTRGDLLGVLLTAKSEARQLLPLLGLGRLAPETCGALPRPVSSSRTQAQTMRPSFKRCI
eukprot:6213952-Pleurochrysis_carterae.AAC.1